MKTTQKKSNYSGFKKLGFGGIGLCAFLCALPAIGTALGVGVLTVAAAYMEKISIALLVLSAGLLGYWFIRRKRKAKDTPSCDIDCSCKAESAADLRR